ncbi:FAD-binding domain-containing protein [Pholiota conissans]|uniref:FAD-binding domain-containing protein n=1 Tax=Pholiota conissans TaxID=109636 RepID=A0A9P5Z6J7_9AGAR|nr:FAD-binding domain-containing protein [Pholiota conissans]
MRFSNVLLAAGFFNATFAQHNATSSVAFRSALRTCSLLQKSLGSEIVQTSGTEYQASASGAWSLFNAEDLPPCIVFPRSTQHVQVAMAAIFRDKIRYAVQAGGHSAMTGWNSVQDGILIFFSHMQNVTYDPTSDTITLQPGIHWGDALSQLSPLGVAPLGGRLGDIGTGLLLGGGLSYLSGEFGFSSNAFVELDVVLVTGKLVTATATNQYSDLFRALKGGANRFGIVTRYQVKAIHIGTEDDKNFFGGVILYPNSSAEALINATAKYVSTVNDTKASILMAFTNSVNGSEINSSHILTLFYHGSSLPNIFGDFLSIPSSFSQIGPVSYMDANSILGAGGDRGFGQLFGASAFKGGVVEQYANAFRAWTDYTNTIESALFATVLAFTPIIDAQTLAGRANGGNLMDPPRGNYAAVQIQTQMLAGVATVPTFVTTARNKLFSRIPRSAGFPLYINECDAGQNVFATYGKFNELKTTYAKYDPTRFNIRFSDGPIGL